MQKYGKILTDYQEDDESCPEKLGGWTTMSSLFVLYDDIVGDPDSALDTSKSIGDLNPRLTGHLVFHSTSIQEYAVSMDE